MTAKPQRLLFGEVAETYDRVRPDYPEALVDDVLSFAGGDRVLEVGCGTGKATVLFAAQGVDLVAVEPSAEMAAVARRNCGLYPNVTIHVTSFEDWQARPARFDLVISAQAWHWVSPEVRFVRAHELLVDGGALALFWNRPARPDTPVQRRLDEVYRRCAPGLHRRIPGTQLEDNKDRDPADLEGSGLFGPVTVRHYPRSVTLSTADYIDLLRTQSDHRMLADAERDRLLDAIAAVVDAAGGTHTIDYVTRLYLGRRLSPSTG